MNFAKTYFVICDFNLFQIKYFSCTKLLAGFWLTQGSFEKSNAVWIVISVFVVYFFLQLKLNLF